MHCRKWKSGNSDIMNFEKGKEKIRTEQMVRAHDAVDLPKLAH